MKKTNQTNLIWYFSTSKFLSRILLLIFFLSTLCPVVIAQKEEFLKEALEAKKIAEETKEIVAEFDKKIDAGNANYNKRIDQLIERLILIGTLLGAIIGLLEIQKRYQDHSKSKEQNKIDKIQLQLSQKNLDRFDESFDSQISNFSKLGEVIDLVQKTFKLQIQASQKHEDLFNTVQDLTELIAKQKNKSRKKFEFLYNGIISFKNLSRMDWPEINSFERNHLKTSLINFQNIDEIVLEEYDEPGKVAQVCYFLGLGAFYDNDINSAIELLTKALNLYISSDKAGSQKNEFLYPYAFTLHFLGIIEKNWYDVNTPVQTNLNKAKSHLEAAQSKLVDKPGEFLTPITYAETLSYLESGREEAIQKLNLLIKKFLDIKATDSLDKNQNKLLSRAYLILGNIDYIKNKKESALEYFEKSYEVKPNFYTLFSKGIINYELKNEIWEKEFSDGLENLKSSGALNKSEKTNLGTTLGWAVIASAKINDQNKDQYFQDFEDFLKNVRQVGKRQPMFFCPISKMLVTRDQLKFEIEKEILK